MKALIALLHTPDLFNLLVVAGVAIVIVVGLYWLVVRWAKQA